MSDHETSANPLDADLEALAQQQSRDTATLELRCADLRQRVNDELATLLDPGTGTQDELAAAFAPELREWADILTEALFVEPEQSAAAMSFEDLLNRPGVAAALARLPLGWVETDTLLGLLLPAWRARLGLEARKRAGVYTQSALDAWQREVERLQHGLLNAMAEHRHGYGQLYTPAPETPGPEAEAAPGPDVEVLARDLLALMKEPLLAHSAFTREVRQRERWWLTDTSSEDRQALDVFRCVPAPQPWHRVLWARWRRVFARQVEEADPAETAALAVLRSLPDVPRDPTIWPALRNGFNRYRLDAEALREAVATLSGKVKIREQRQHDLKAAVTDAGALDTAAVHDTLARSQRARDHVGELERSATGGAMPQPA
jgi:hypothetical protein